MMTAYDVVVRSKWFSLTEFTEPDGTSFAEDLRFVRARLLEELELLRVDYGKPIHPSRDRYGLIRREGSTGSRHYVGEGRMGNAIDVFPEGDPGTFMAAVMMRMAFRGIGVYGDTNLGKLQPGPMFHLDTRPGEIALWVRLDGKYTYWTDNAVQYFEALSEAFKHGRS